MPELSGNNMLTGGNMGTGVNSQTQGSGFSFGAGNNLGSGTLGGLGGMGGLGSYGAGSNTGTAVETPKQVEQSFEYTGMNEKEISMLNREATKQMEKKGLTGDTAMYAELTKVYDAYSKKKKQQEQLDNSIAQTRALIDASYRVNDPKLKNEYNSTARIQSLGTAMKLWFENKGKNYNDYADEDLILNYVSKYGKDKDINQYIGGKMSLPDLLVKMGMGEQAPIEQEKIDEKNIIKEQMRNVDSKTSQMIHSYFDTPIEMMGQGARDMLDGFGTAIGLINKEDLAFSRYLEDKYGTSNLNNIPDTIKEAEKAEFTPELAEQYSHGFFDGTAEMGIGLVDTFFKLQAPWVMAAMTALEDTPVGDALGVTANAIGTMGVFTNPVLLAYYSQLSPDIQKQFTGMYGGLLTAKMLGAKKGGAKFSDKGYLSQLLDPREVIYRHMDYLNDAKRFADNSNKFMIDSGKQILQGFEDSGLAGAWDAVKGIGKDLGSSLYDKTIKPVTEGVENAVPVIKDKVKEGVKEGLEKTKELGKKAIKSWSEYQIKRSFEDKPSIWEQGKNAIKGELENSPEFMEMVRVKNAEGNPQYNAGKLIENQLNSQSNFSKKFYEDFKKKTGKDVGDFLNDEGLYGGDNPDVTRQKVEESYIKDLEHVDDILDTITERFYNEDVEKMAKEVNDDARESDSDTKFYWDDMYNKARNQGLTPKEMREVKQYYERNNTLDYQKAANQGSSTKLRKALNIDSRVRKFQYALLDSIYNFPEMAALAKQIQAKRMILNEFGNQDVKFRGNKGISYADIVSLSNGSLGTILLKEFVKDFNSPETTAMRVDTINKATNHTVNEPIRGNKEGVSWENFKRTKIEQPVEEDVNKTKLPYKSEAPTYDGLSSIFQDEYTFTPQTVGYPHMSPIGYEGRLYNMSKEGGLPNMIDTRYGKRGVSAQEPLIIDMSKDLSKDISIDKDNIVNAIESEKYQQYKEAYDAQKKVEKYNEEKAKERLNIINKFFKQGGLFD